MPDYSYAKLRREDIAAIAEHLRAERLRRGRTFLGILGREHDEEMLSRILACLLTSDALFAGRLASYAFGEEISLQEGTVSCDCEKFLPGGRIDLFLTASGRDGVRYTVTIENKVDSFEHSEQTQRYYDYITANCPQSRNAFLFLKPAYNQSPCACAQFVPITYGELYKMISADDPIAEDFKRHIREYLSEKEVRVDESVKEILRNYREIRAALSEAEKQLEMIRLAAFSQAVVAAKAQGGPWETLHRGGSSRIFRPEWRNEGAPDPGGKYFFYSELYFVDGSPQKIVVQSTVQRYGQRASESMVWQYLSGSGVQGYWDGAYFVHYASEFQTQCDFFGADWQEALKQFALREIARALEESQKAFSGFAAYLRPEIGG